MGKGLSTKSDKMKFVDVRFETKQVGFGKAVAGNVFHR